VTISGLSNDLTGFNGGTYTAAAGTWTGTAAQFAALAFNAGEDGVQTLSITAATSGPEAGSTTEGYTLTVKPVSEPPTLTLGGTTASVNEGGSVALPSFTATGADADDALTLTVSGLAAGATITDSVDSTVFSGSSFTLTGPEAASTLTLHDATNEGNFTLSVTANNITSGEAASSATKTISVTVNPAPETPTLTLGATTASVNEGAAVALPSITAAGLDGDDVLTLTVSGLAAGVTITDSVDSTVFSSSTFTLTGAEVGSTLTLHDGTNEGNFTLSVTANNTTSGEAASSAAQSISVTVNPVAEGPVLGGSTSATVSEGALVTLGVTDTTVDGDDTLGTVTITGLPSDLSGFSGGTYTSGTGTWTGTAAQFAALTFHAGETSATMSISATSTESTGQTGTTVESYALTVSPVTEAPTLAAGTFTSVTLPEGGSVSGVFAIGVHDADDTLTLTVANLPSGVTLTDSVDGNVFSGSSFTLNAAEAASTLTLHDVTNEFNFTLGVTANNTTPGEIASSALLIVPVLVGSPEGPILGGVTSASVSEGGSVTLGVTEAKFDTDDILGTVTITGLPNDLGGFNGGTYTAAAGTWTGTAAQFAALTFTAGETSATLTISATNTAPGETASTVETYALTVSEPSEMPTIVAGTNSDGTKATFIVTFNEAIAGLTVADFAGFGTAQTGGEPPTLALSSGPGTSFTVTATYNHGQDKTLSYGLNFVNNTGVHETETGETGNLAVGTNYTVPQFSSLAPAGVSGSEIDIGLSDPAAPGATVNLTVSGVPAAWTLNAGTLNSDGSWTVLTTDPSSLTVTTPSTFTGAAVLQVSETWTNTDGSTGSANIADNVEAYAPGSPIFALSGDDTLTGAGGADQFVFSQPIGNDTIHNFNTAMASIDLVGFNGFNSFADVQASTADDANGNAVITLGSGETITLAGVDAAQLGAGDFAFNQQPAVNNPGAMTISDGAILPLDGAVANAGTIALNSTGDETDLEILGAGVTLSGGGQVILSDSNQNVIFGATASVTLTNADNTISGAGQIGAGSMNLANAGVIDASGTNALVIDTGANVVANSGVLETTGAGGLVVDSALDNTGSLLAQSGAMTLKGAVTGAGTATISGSAILEYGAASAEATGFAPGAAGTLKLDQSSSFSGVVTGFAAGDGLDLADVAFGPSTTLGFSENGAGTGGTLTVSDGAHTASIALMGQFAAAGFQQAADGGGGGSFITYTPPPAMALPSPN
jgi:hypothetical protein